MPNQMDTRNRNAFEIVEELRKIEGLKLAVLGSHNLNVNDTHKAIVDHWSEITELVGEDPERLLTGCRPSGSEKAVRLAAKEVTGKLAVVFHRADVTYSPKMAQEMMVNLLAQEADALLVLSNGSPVCAEARSRFIARNKKVYEIEVG